MIPPGVSFFVPKNRITQGKLNQTRKYFNPLLAQAGSNYEKNEGRKSRWTVPLINMFL